MRSFGLVDNKVSEAEFFLQKIKQEAVDPITVGFFFSAYVSAARSITFCLQAVLKHRVGFVEWYLQKQKVLKRDPLATFFVEARNLSQKVGVVPITEGACTGLKDGQLQVAHFFAHEHPDFNNLPEVEVGIACTKNFQTLLEIVYDCYIQFGRYIDPQQYYTSENFEMLGLSIEDAEEEIFGVRGWTGISDMPIQYRWQMIRSRCSCCEILHFFDKYLAKSLPQPEHLPPLEQKNTTTGWVYIPLSDEEKTGDSKKDILIHLKKTRKGNE